MVDIPPSYADLGKKSRDLFSKGYNYGFYKIEAKTSTEGGVEFTTNGNSNHESGRINGTLETKYKWKEHGVTLLEKWNTDNIFSTEITIDDQIMKGLKLAFDTQLSPESGKKSGKIKTEYQREHIHTNCDLDFDFVGPTLHTTAVLGHRGWLAGCQLAIDAAKAKLLRSNFALGYVADDFTMHTNINDGLEYGASVYQKINNKLESGIQLTWCADNNVTRFGIGAKYSPNDDVTYRAKVNNSSQVGLSYQHKVGNGITLTLSALIEGKSFSQGRHKVGLGIEFESNVETKPQREKSERESREGERGRKEGERGGRKEGETVPERNRMR